MPEIFVHAVKGRTLEQKKALVKTSPMRW